MKRIPLILGIFTIYTFALAQNRNIYIKINGQDSLVATYDQLYPEYYKQTKSTSDLYYIDTVTVYRMATDWQPLWRIVYTTYSGTIWTQRLIQQYISGQWLDSLVETRTFNSGLLEKYLITSPKYNDTIKFYAFNDTSLVTFIEKSYGNGRFINGYKYEKQLTDNHLPARENYYTYTTPTEISLQNYIIYQYTDNKLQQTEYYVKDSTGEFYITDLDKYFYADTGTFYDSLIHYYNSETNELTPSYARKTLETNGQEVTKYRDWIYIFDKWQPYSYFQKADNWQLSQIWNFEASDWGDTLHYELWQDTFKLLQINKNYYIPEYKIRNGNKLTYKYANNLLTNKITYNLDVHTSQWLPVALNYYEYYNDQLTRYLTLLWNKDSLRWDSVYLAIYAYTNGHLTTVTSYIYNSGWHPSIKKEYIGHSVNTNIATYFTKVKIYPNPAYDYITISNTSPNSKIQIISIDGKHKKTTIYNNKVYIGDLTPGVYFLITEKSKTVFVKL